MYVLIKVEFYTFLIESISTFNFWTLIKTMKVLLVGYIIKSEYLFSN